MLSQGSVLGLIFFCYTYMTFIQEFKIVLCADYNFRQILHETAKNPANQYCYEWIVFTFIHRLETNTKKTTTLYFHISTLTESTFRIKRTQHSSFRIFRIGRAIFYFGKVCIPSVRINCLENHNTCGKGILDIKYVFQCSLHQFATLPILLNK